MVGAACEEMAQPSVESAALAASSPDLRRAARHIEALDARDPSLAEIRAADRYYLDQAGLRIPAMYQFRDVLVRSRMLSVVWRWRSARRRTLMAKLAVVAYEREHGSAPSDLSALGPVYLTRVPTDAFSVKPLGYVVRPGGFVVYSVGPDRKDDGGRPCNTFPAPKARRRGDVCAGVPETAYVSPAAFAAYQRNCTSASTTPPQARREGRH